MKTTLYNSDGKKTKEIELPKVFSSNIRNDIVSKVLETKKTQQPYSPSPVGGKQHSASGVIRHKRHAWKNQYGRGISRVPRKIMSRRGSQFNWVAAEIPNARGGRRAHPPKILQFLNSRKINKKEMRIAILSALAATANSKFVSEKYSRLNNKKIETPFVVEGKILNLKTKEFLKAVKNILGEEVYDIALKEKSIRAGIGKRRGRKYKSNAGMLVVVGKNENLKTGAFEITNAGKLNVSDLSRGGLGRLTMYTENALNEINKKFGGKE